MPPISMQVVTPPRSSSAIEKSTQARPAASSCASLRTGSISNRPEYQNCGLPRSSMNERSSGEPAMWAWVVMRPGVSTRSRASSVSSAGPSSVRPTWTMRSPSTTTTPSRSRRWPRPSKATIQPAWIAVRRAITSLRDDGRVEPHDDVAADGAGIWQRGQLADHLREVALHERLHLGAVHGDVVVEVWVWPDDRVHLAHGAAGVGLEVLDVGRGPRRRGADHDGGGAVAEDHARGAHGADLVGELLAAHDEHGPLDFLQQAHRLREPVGQPRAGGHDVARGVRLEHAEPARQPGGQ